MMFFEIICQQHDFVFEIICIFIYSLLSEVSFLSSLQEKIKRTWEKLTKLPNKIRF
jgi:hypothetical protein